MRRTVPDQASLRRREARRPPARGKKRWGLRVGLLGIMILLSVLIVREIRQYRSAQEEYLRYQQLEEASIPEVFPTETYHAAAGTVANPAQAASAAPAAPSEKPFYSGKVALLLEENADTVGWIEIPGTRVRYPVVQADDNEYYLTRTFERRDNESGAIYMDYRNAGDLSDFNTIVYGHNMLDGSMFHDLREYRHPEYARDHSRIELTLLSRKMVFQVFSAYTRKDDFDFMGFGIYQDVDREQLIERIRRRTEVSLSARVGAQDQLLTLVTCTSGSQEWHWIVHAVLVEEVRTGTGSI